MRTVLIVCSCFLSLVSAAHAVTFADITFDAASKRAAAQNKWVLVDFHATWCAGSHVMDKVTWPDPAVTRLLDAHCVALRAEAEKGAALSARFKVDAFPTSLVLRPDGTEVGRIVGYHDATSFLKQFNALLDVRDVVADARGGVDETGGNARPARIRLAASLPNGESAPAARPAAAYRMTRQTVAGLAPMQWVFIIVTPEGYPWVASHDRLRWMIEQAVPANATLEWSPGCKGGGERPLDTAQEVDAVRAFCLGRNVKLVSTFPGDPPPTGQFLRAPGEVTLNDGDKQVALTVSTAEHNGGKLSATITRRVGDATVSRTSSQHLKPNAWFVFVESASRVWIFDGKHELCVLVMDDHAWSLADAADPTVVKHMKACPTEVRQALPEDVRRKYLDG